MGVEVMFTFGTVMTMAGGTLAVSMIEFLLETMGKEKYAQILRLIAMAGMSVVGFGACTELFDVMGRFLQ
jgi:hypothetical protein